MYRFQRYVREGLTTVFEAGTIFKHNYVWGFNKDNGSVGDAFEVQVETTQPTTVAHALDLLAEQYEGRCIKQQQEPRTSYGYEGFSTEGNVVTIHLGT